MRDILGFYLDFESQPEAAEAGRGGEELQDFYELFDDDNGRDE